MTADKNVPLYHLTMRQAGGLIRDRKISPVDLTRAFLDRIERIDGRLQSFVTVLPEKSIADARQAEADIQRGDYIGPLHGIPIALKDLYDTKGVLTTSSSKVMASRIPQEDSTAARRLRDAGAVLLGKLTMHEFALGGPDPTTGFPMARNPWNQDHIPGGSSSGSAAATAAGMAMGTLGSCTGGSIRGPASHSGVVGLKPTYGRVSRYGVVPLSWTLDHCGPITWTVEDAALLLGAIAGHDPKDPTSSLEPVPDYTSALRTDVKGLKIGVPRHFFFSDDNRINKDTLSLAEKGITALENMGAHVEEVTIPSLKYNDSAHPVILLSEAFAYHAPNLRRIPEKFGNNNRLRFRTGGLFSSADYIQAQRFRNALKKEFSTVLSNVDVIASPTMSTPAQRFEDVNVLTTSKVPSFTSPYNMTGLPAISVPCGFTPEGLPVGLQIAGRPFEETTIIRAAYTYEQFSKHSDIRPPI